MTKEAGERSFDELASGLASGSLSRGKALKWLGAALLGGALAFTPKVAEADPLGWCYQGEIPRCFNRPPGQNRLAREMCEEARAADETATSPRCRPARSFDLE
jgi:hypothetical protein